MQKSINVKTTNPEAKRKEGSFTFNFGDTLQENVEKFGEQRVFDMFIDSGIILLQGYARRGLTNGATDEEIQAKLDEYKFDKRTRAAGEGSVSQLLSMVVSGKRTKQDLLDELAAKIDQELAKQAEQAEQPVQVGA